MRRLALAAAAPTTWAMLPHATTPAARIPPLLLAALCGACGGGSPSGEPAAANVVLVVVDTLGAGHLGAWGAETRTPTVDRLAARGARFERAYSTAPWTKPSVASLLTGLMPSSHGVRKLNDRLADDVLTLAELAEQGGLRTHAVVSHTLLTPEHGYGQGFGSFDGSAISGHDGITSADVTDRALAYLDTLPGGDERFFLFVHYFDPHYAYHHHAPFAHTGAYDGPVEPAMEIWSLRDRRDALGEEDLAYLRGLYREEVAFTDHHVGRLLRGLEERGLGDETLVVFTADHGEELMEHGWIGHTRTLYDELLRIPLVLSLPGVLPPRTVAEPVSLLDVTPTIAQLAGLPRRPEWEGVSLAPLLLEGRAVHADRPVFAEVTFGRDLPAEERRNPHAGEKFAHKTAVILNDAKLVHDEPSDSWELYDRSTDAGERRNLWEEGMEGTHPLHVLLRAWEAGRGSRTGPSAELDDAALDELRKLGYVR